MSEMHDGIGSQLTLALSLVRRMDREANPGAPRPRMARWPRCCARASRTCS